MVKDQLNYCKSILEMFNIKEEDFIKMSDTEIKKISNHFSTAQVLDRQGDISKILHKCDYEKGDYDIYNYQPKVSKSERNAGCDDMSEKIMNNTETQSRTWNDRCLTCGKKFVGSSETICHCPSELKITDKTVFKWKNNHPTLKPIKLNERILKLFKTPNEQKICYPFAGSGSEIIGGIKAGFTNWVGCEINQEYVDIAIARIKHWTSQQEQLDIFEVLNETV